GDNHSAGAPSPAIGAKSNAPAQAVAYQHRLGFGYTKLPRAASVFDAAQRAGARTAVKARDEDVIGIGFGDTGGHRADTRFGHQLDANAPARIYPLQVVDQLSQIFDGV